MTANRRSKRAVRSRMEQTGEKYTQARRALAAPGGDSGGTGEDPPIAWPQDSLGWFDDQAWNSILLADDEARMLSHPRVDPEHLLLAAARYGDVERLLAGQGIDARAVHDVIVQIKGFGGKLKLRPHRSPASEQVLRRAVAVAAARGLLGPGTAHLLIALGEQELPAQILAELGVGSAQALVDADQGLPPKRPPVDQALLEERAAVLATRGIQPPSPGPIPPIFERFTTQSRAAINAAVEYARRANDRWVEPVHLLSAVLDAEAGVAAAVRARYDWHRPPAQPRDPGATDTYRRDPEHDNVLWYTKSPHSRATGIFTPEARRIVAEDALIIAERLDHRPLTTGHLLLAVLERYAYLTIDFIDALPPIREITAAVIDALPGQEDT
jgi:ATP-dependent Clp protease ATP-binding subunit ClpA